MGPPGLLHVGPLPLAEGASPCCGCGFCCRKTTCGAAPYDHAKGRCAALVDNGDGTCKCGKYAEIMAMPQKVWWLAPAFGAGCCSPGNSDRKRIAR